MNMKEITEAKDVTVYKQLLHIFGDYVKSFPCTGIDNLFDALVDNGKKILPKDKRALGILEYLLCTYFAPDVVQRLLNIRFADLPAPEKPITKNGRKHEVASWERNGITSDRVKDLIDFSNTGKQGKWSNIDGEKVGLIEI